MCITKEISLGAFILCSMTCVYLYKRNLPNDKWISIMFGYFGSMQFLEYLMWTDQSCTGLNQLATDIGFWHTILQPMISIVVAYYLTDGNIPVWMYAVLALYLLTSLPLIINSKKTNQCSLPCKPGGNGLSWKYTNTTHSLYVWAIFCISLALPFLQMKHHGHLYAGFIIGTYILSYFLSSKRCPTSLSPSNGSWWCLMAVFIPLIALKLN